MQPKIHQTYQPLPLNPNQKPASANKSTTSFQEVLNQQLTLTKHAKERLDERNISIPSEQWAKISEKLTEAKDKGVRDSLVLTEEAALIVNTKNNTVVTAMDKKSAESRLFTNIDGTIIM
ncbi:TIGR02530 family flagellar biosynthesis protein [Salimicrobium flavidum]|uniref:Flagellar operon protein n=1 Tax=Salimicrobium flavidum TaxID=570947 RepID=A0A1N7IKL4_9BACI|nr:TIGR02530 family flagellar biosynthesis protein [Salimicrobium flavidum]SIS37633.1 flagellar operon protein [Salimicrobium flavidum]